MYARVQSTLSPTASGRLADSKQIPPKYEKGDTVNKTIRDADGTLRRAILTVRSARWDPDGGYWEYLLLETPGAWIRERELKLNKKRT